MSSSSSFSLFHQHKKWIWSVMKINKPRSWHWREASPTGQWTDATWWMMRNESSDVDKREPHKIQRQFLFKTNDVAFFKNPSVKPFSSWKYASGSDLWINCDIVGHVHVPNWSWIEERFSHAITWLFWNGREPVWSRWILDCTFRLIECSKSE